MTTAVEKYVASNDVHSPGFKKILADFSKKINNLSQAYDMCLSRFSDVLCPAFNSLPVQFKSVGDYVKKSKFNFSERGVKDNLLSFELKRLETCKAALLHFSNANMYLHAQALELYSQTYEQLNSLNFVMEMEVKEEQR